MDGPLTHRPRTTVALLMLVLALSTGAVAQERHARQPGGDPIVSSDQTVRIYEVFDITGFLDGPLLPDLGEMPSDPHEAAALLEELGEREHLRAEAVDRAESLAEMLRAFLAPELGDATIDVHGSGSLLVVVAEERAHTWITDVLEQLRADPPTLVTMEALVVRGPAGVSTELLLEPTHTLLDDAAQVVLRQQVTERNLEIVTAPRLTTFPAQRGQVTVMREIAYVSDWQLRTIEPGGQRIADPTVDVLHDGLMLDVVALPLRDGHLGLTVNLQISGVEEPIPTLPVRLAEDLDPVEVGRPVVTTVGLDTEIVLSSGGAVAFVTQDPERIQDVIVVLQVLRLEPETAAEILDR